MMNWLKEKRWSPYAAGTLIGLLSWFTFLTVDHPIGVSSAVVRTVAMVESVVVPQHVKANTYFQRFPPSIDWEWALVAGIMVGAALSSRLSGSASVERVPELWVRRFGPSVAKRYVAAFFGGILLIGGARLAGGCTSGHGISGSLQLALSSWTFFLTLFASGVATASWLYGKEGRRG